MLAVTGPQQYEEVVAAVHEAAPPVPTPFIDLVPEAGPQADPAPLQLFEDFRGLQPPLRLLHHPVDLRGDLVSRRPDAILREAEKLVAAGTKELLVISQDTSAYGVDIRHQARPWKGERSPRPHDRPRRASWASSGAWVRLHYVYPYPHVDNVIPLMAEGLVLPYLDIPFQHASPEGAARDAPPGQRRQGARSASATGASRSPTSRSARPSSSASPARPRRISQYLLDWLEEAQLDRVGAFKFEPVEGAAANALHDQVPEDVKQERYERVMALSARICAEKLAAKVGSTIDVLIDAVDDETGGATGRSKADAPEIDGEVHLRDAGGLKPGDIVRVHVEDSDEHDLFGVPA